MGFGLQGLGYQGASFRSLRVEGSEGLASGFEIWDWWLAV